MYYLILLMISLFFCLFSEVNAQLISEEKVKQWQAAFPRIENDEEVKNALTSENTLFYTDDVMPRAYQFQGTIHSPYYNIAANKQFDRQGHLLAANANFEFPWDKPAGTDLVKNLVTLRFVYLPPSDNGVKWPIVYWPSRVNGDPVYQWIFPTGTIVGEILAFYPDGANYSYIYEIRVRKRTFHSWEMDVFKPFQTVKELASKLREYGREDLATKLETPNLLNWRLTENNTRQAIFRVEMPLDFLPEFNDDELVKKLLQEPFYSSTGMPWRWNDEGKTVTNGPFTKENFSIVPANYLGSMVALTNESCTKCHRTTLHHSNEFTPNLGGNPAGREWYGRERGSDGIFSFHIFDPSCISGNGTSMSVVLRQKLVQTGYIAQFNPKVHSDKIYNRVQEYMPENTSIPENDSRVIRAR